MGVLFGKNREKLRELKVWDILIITFILFYSAIVSSTEAFLATGSKSIIQMEEVTSAQNYYAMLIQGSLLVLVFIYLKLRNFDFSQWKFEINIKTIFSAVLIFIFVALVMDLFSLAYFNFSDAGSSASAQSANGNFSIFDIISLSSVLYAFLNGFYEEIYFIGICLAVKPEHRKYYFLFSLLIRFSFHTYQGIFPALGICLVLGIIYYMLFTKFKKDNLFLFTFSHTIADIIGLGIISYFL